MGYRKRRGASVSAAGQQSTRAKAESNADLAPLLLTIAQQLKKMQEDLESIKKRAAALEGRASAQSTQTAPMVEQARELMQTLQSLFGAGQATRKSESPMPPSPGPSAPSAEGSTAQAALWMTANPAQLVPNWVLWGSDFLNRLNAYVENQLQTIPNLLTEAGETETADKLRKWMASDKLLVLQVAALMTRRIVATSPAARQSAQQWFALALAIVRDLQHSLSIEPTEDTQRIASFLSQDPRLPVMLASCLTTILRNIEAASSVLALLHLQLTDLMLGCSARRPLVALSHRPSQAPAKGCARQRSR